MQRPIGSTHALSRLPVTTSQHCSIWHELCAVTTPGKRENPPESHPYPSVQEKQSSNRQQRPESTQHAWAWRALGRKSDQSFCHYLLHRLRHCSAAQWGQHELCGHTSGQQLGARAGVCHLLAPVPPGQLAQEGCGQPEESAAGRSELCQAHPAVLEGWLCLMQLLLLPQQLSFSIMSHNAESQEKCSKSHSSNSACQHPCLVTGCSNRASVLTVSSWKSPSLLSAEQLFA